MPVSGTLFSGTQDNTYTTAAKGILWNGTGTGSGAAPRWGASDFISVGANTTLGTAIGSGLIIFSDISDGGSAMVLFDAGFAAVTIVSQTGTNFQSSSDPGAGSSKWWVQPNGVITNRYAAAKNLGYALVASRGGTLV